MILTEQINTNFPTIHGYVNANIKSTERKVDKIKIEKKYNTRNMLEFVLNQNPISAIPIIERIEYDSQMHYGVCFIRLIEQASNIKLNKDIDILRKIFLNIETVFAGYVYLSRIFQLLDNNSLYQYTMRAIDLLYDQNESISGHRIYTTINLPNALSVDFTFGSMDIIIKNTKKLSLMTKELEKELIKKEAIKNTAFGTKQQTELRTNFGSIIYAISVLENLVKKNYSYKKVEPQNLINKESLQDGSYKESINTIRGLLDITMSIKDGLISEIDIISPSDKKLKYLNNKLKHTLVDYFQINFESLNISMLEIDK